MGYMGLGVTFLFPQLSTAGARQGFYLLNGAIVLDLIGLQYKLLKL